MENIKDLKISVIGLGYVGLPIAVAMAEKYSVIGFDINKARIDELKKGVDRTKEVASKDLKAVDLEYTCKGDDLKKANFHIVTVPTPIDGAHIPDLSILLKASETVGKALSKGDIVVYESTVYPGTTEEDCVPILEKHSGLKFGVDFKVGYSPERINPGDKEHTFKKITKVVSAQDSESLKIVSEVYSSVVEAGVFEAKTIKVAEAAKVIENTQRDLNIALMNELALIFDKMNIDTLSVLEAAGTKWNFLKFTPGLVGGHCIGVDPYYLTYKAEREGYIPQVILSGRSINDNMGKFVAEKVVKAMIHEGFPVRGDTVTIFGLTFKENCPDIRNTRVTDIIKELDDFGVNVVVCDPEADPEEVHEEYGIELVPLDKLRPAKACVFAVPHNHFKNITPENMSSYAEERAVIYDVKGLFDPVKLFKANYTVLRL